jgi:hypothetical protein
LNNSRWLGWGVVMLTGLAMAWRPAGAADPPPGGAPAPASVSTASPPPSPAPKLALLKPPPAGAGTLPWLPDYLRVLERFPLELGRHWHAMEDRGEALGYYGSGDRPGVVAEARALLALAYLSGEPGYDPRPSGVPAAALRDQALRSLRRLVRTHVTGDLDRIGGGRWGDDERAGLVIGPLALASRLLASQLAPPEKVAVERVTAHEADRLLDRAPAAGEPQESRAAQNAEAVVCLAWAAAQLPGHPHVPRWEQQCRLFAMNTLSVPQDRADAGMVDSRPVREWVRTENLLPEYLEERGGGVSPGAALTSLGCLSNGYFAYAVRGQSVPQALTHHFEDVWHAALRFWLGGSLFVQPAGSDAASDASEDVGLFPATSLLEWVGSEPSVARRIERNCFQALEAEQIARGDGSFFGSGPDEEAAAAESLVLAALIHRKHGVLITPADPAPLRRQETGAWASPAAALVVARSRSCFASWSWRSVGHPSAPIGLFVPVEAEVLALPRPDELVGSFDLQGSTNARALQHREQTFDGGFSATGQLDEGLKDGRSGIHHFVSFTALPSQRIAILFDLGIAAQAVTVNRNEGLQIGLPVERADHSRPTLRGEEGELPLTPAASDAAADPPLASPWLSVDDRLGIAALYSQEPLVLRMDTQAGMRIAVIDNPMTTKPTTYQPGQVVRDTVTLLVAGDAASTTRLAKAAEVLPTGSELVRAAIVTGVEGNRYLVAANFGPKETRVTLRPTTAAPWTDLRLAPLGATVLLVEH